MVNYSLVKLYSKTRKQSYKAYILIIFLVIVAVVILLNVLASKKAGKKQ